MKTFLGLSISLLLFGLQGHSQSEPFISTMDFVEVLNGNREEAHYYYNHNWKQIREKAKINGYIHSFSFLEVEKTEKIPFDFVLVTTYTGEHQFNQREKHFQELIVEAEGPIFLNDVKPDDFRRTVFGPAKVIHKTPL